MKKTLATYTQDYGSEGCDWGNREALTHALEHGWTINKYADPIEEDREGMDLDAALEVCTEDPDLIWLEHE